MTEAAQRFGPYLLEARLGSGGMGEVWRALDTRLGRPVALKLLMPALGQDPRLRERFRRESRAASALNHPNIVTIYEAGELEGRLYQAGELVEGQTLREILRQGPLPPSRATEIARQVLAGLAAAHDAGIVHRDIKPENLMVRPDGYVKILDFGLARLREPQDLQLTPHDAVLGSPRYMAPEQAMSGEVDGRSDLFSVGAVLYEMLRGAPAFPGESLGEVISALLHRQPDPLPGVQPSLERVIRRAMQKDPDQRYPDARAMLADLAGAESLEPSGERRRPETSLLILPLAARHEDEDLAEGLSDELITRLGGLSGLAVIGRSTAWRCRDLEAREAGRELGVGLVLEGRLRSAGGRVRVTVALVEASQGFTLWSDRFEAPLGDIFEVQDQIAAGIVAALQKRFQDVRPGPARAGVRGRGGELYLRGLRALSSLDAEQGSAALKALEEAVQLAPEFAPARARLSQALVHAASTMPPDQAVRATARALEEARRALKLDPECVEALVALALLDIREERWVEGRRLLRRALELAPGDVEALGWLSYVSTTMGSAEEGLRLARRALQLDPEGALPSLWASYALASLGRHLEAASLAERSLRLESRNLYCEAVLLMLDLARGRWQDAARYAEHLRARGTDDPFCTSALLLFQAVTDPASLTGLTLEEVACLRRDQDCERLLADAFAVLGRTEEAVSLLRSSFARGNRNLAHLEADVFLEKARAHPGFAELRQEMQRAVAEDRELWGP